MRCIREAAFVEWEEGRGAHHGVGRHLRSQEEFGCEPAAASSVGRGGGLLHTTEGGVGGGRGRVRVTGDFIAVPMLSCTERLQEWCV